MTYDVLEKVSKEELIQWMRNNVFLPDIEKEKELNKRLEANTGNTVAFMTILIESNRNDEKIEKINTEIHRLLGLKGGAQE